MKVTFKTVSKGGVIRYENENGKYHREDGPAYIDGDYKTWCINGKIHREDGPAIIDGNFKAWFIDGKNHREDGPAVEYTNGDVEYWLNGEQYTEEEFEHELVKRKLQKVKEL